MTAHGGRDATHRIFGRRLASDFDFRSRLPAGTGAPDLTFRCHVDAPAEATGRTELAYASEDRVAGGRSRLELHRGDGYDLLRFAHVADFYVRPDLVVCHLLRPDHRQWIEIWFLGIVMAFWLERRGAHVLHASAVSVGGEAVGFLSAKHGGKSTLAASLVALGHPLLSDDLLVVEETAGDLLVSPGYAQMRMWPDQAGWFVPAPDSLDRVFPTLSKRIVPVGGGGFGRMATGVVPLRRLYLPRRIAVGDVAIEPLPFADAALSVVGHTFLSDLRTNVEAEAGRFLTASRLCGRIPVRALTFPSGEDVLPRVAREILADVGAATANEERA